MSLGGIIKSSKKDSRPPVLPCTFEVLDVPVHESDEEVHEPSQAMTIFLPIGLFTTGIESRVTVAMV